MAILKDIEIIDEQKDFIVVNKPAGVGFHDETGVEGFFNQVKSLLKIECLYPVHRLDKITSGLIIFAKSKLAAAQFQKLFENREIDKYYLAISNNKPKKKQGLIKGDMTKSRRGMWKLLRTQNNPAISQFFSYSVKEGTRLYIIKPFTGKTHQIRVALNSIGAPILGDILYNQSSCVDRGYLHAYAIKFKFGGGNYSYVCTPQSGNEFISEGTQALIETLHYPWDLPWPKVVHHS